jgi:HD-GYP domain-containing protein (c-di-GMP phosphodiesterase class II)
MDWVPAEEKLHSFELLHRIGVALAAERDRDRLVETILLEAKKLCNADGGTLYLVADGGLQFAMIHSDSLGMAQGGTTGNPIELPPIALRTASGEPNRSNVAACAFHDQAPVHVADAYSSRQFDFSGTHAFDARHSYRSVSLLAIPLVGSRGEVLGVLQLINAREPGNSRPVAFSSHQQRTVTAMAAQAGLALDNQALLEGQRNLLDAFIKLIAEAIDAKSPYTGSHCERVPVLTEMIVESLCEAEQGPYSAFHLNEEQWRELRVAAWLHDCGKVTTPVHVMDKATKLETIVDRIALVAARFAVLAQYEETSFLQALLDGEPEADARARRDRRLAQLRDDEAFIRAANQGGEFLGEDAKARIQEIGARPLPSSGTLLTPDEVENLCVARGTLTHRERLIVNGHMVQTVNMLEKLPFPSDLRNVPEYATGHHERMDGKGYPRGLYAGDLSLPARVLAIADVFEALTASDRPYKDGKKLSESLAIMSGMKENNHLDAELLDHFVESGVYRRYAERFLPREQIDEVDEAQFLAIKPRPFVLPAPDERNRRRCEFLPDYRDLFASRTDS